MASPNVPRTGLRRTPVTFADWGLAYKVALGDVALGLFVAVCSPFVGGIFHRGLSWALGILGAPADRALLPANEPRTGTDLLLLIGLSILVVGVCVFAVRLVLELLGLAGAPMLTRRVRPRGRLAWGTAAAGLVVFAAAEFPSVVLSLLFVDAESSISGVVSALDVMSQAGRLLMVCSLITLFLWRRGWHGRLGALFGWADAVGWARLHWGWLNRLGAALLVAGIAAQVPFLPFDDVASAFTVAGIIVLISGVVPQLAASGRP